jgi:transcription elongation factor Elf1
MADKLTPLPCPFCGEIGVNVHEASTFRWVVAECNFCGAQCGEVRVDTLNKEWTETMSWGRAVEEWNNRKVQP